MEMIASHSNDNNASEGQESSNVVVPWKKPPASELDPYGLIGARFQRTFVGYGKQLWDVEVLSHNGNGSYKVLAKVDNSVINMKGSVIAKYLEGMERKEVERPTQASNVVAEPASEPASAASEPARKSKIKIRVKVPTRRSSRARKSRFINIDGHTVLRANNYGMDEGIATISGSDYASKQRAAVKALSGPQTAYNIFCADYRSSNLHSTLAEAAVAWNLLSDVGRTPYIERAEEDKVRYANDVAKLETEMAMIEAEQSNIAAQLEKEAQEQRIAFDRAHAEKRQRAAERKMNGATKKRRVMTPAQRGFQSTTRSSKTK